MKPTFIIGLCGKAGSGKDTAGNWLVKQYDYERRAFADELKRIAFQHFGITQKELDYKFLSTRKFLQQLGVCFRKEIKENFLIEKAFPSGILGKTVLTDVRFPNEVEWINENGGINIRIDRPDNPATLEGTEANHISEQPNKLLVDYTMTNIENNRASLYAQIDECIEKEIE